MQRSLLIIFLSAALAFGPICLESTVVQSAAPEIAQPRPAEAADKSDRSKSAAGGATARSEPEAKPRAVNAKPGRLNTRRASRSGGQTRVQMRNVDFHIDDTIILSVRNLRGALLRTKPSAPPYFDERESFNIRIDSGIIAMKVESLANLLNNYVFAYPKAPLKEVSLSTEGNQIKMKGKVHKVTDLHFEIVGELHATPEGKIQLHPTSIKTAGIPVKGLMGLFGIELDELIKGTESRGVKIDDNDITMDPEIMVPPPQIRGKITAVRIEGDEVIQVFGAGNNGPTPSMGRGPNYMHYLGGTIRFGKLTMSNADLRLVDQNPKNPFDFSLEHFNDQLVAGYSQNTPSRGLVVHTPDYSKIQGKSSRVISGTAAGKTLAKP